MKDALFIVMQHCLPQHLISRLVGCLAASRMRWIKNPFIRWFVKRYQVDMAQAVESDATAYASFNDFFTRALKGDARPLPDDESLLVSPADGRISECGAIVLGQVLQAKDKMYSVEALLGGNTTLAAEFEDGCFATVYLSPRDYHRVHMPVAGTLRETHYVPGKLFSVNQLTAERVDQLFARNERLVCLFDTDRGPMALVLVGAMIVAGIDTVWAGQAAPASHGLLSTDYTRHSPPIQFARGAEIGRFRLGSTVVALFGPEVCQLKQSLQAGDPIAMGQAIGRACDPQHPMENAHEQI